MNTLDAFVAHARHTRFDHLSPAAVAAAKQAIEDSLACAIIGSRADGAEELWRAQNASPQSGTACVWGRATRAHPSVAAMQNGHQLHALEYASVHERATVHAMSAILPAVMASADRDGGVDGKRLITAVAVGLDVAALLGMAAKQGSRFFRPSVCGSLGAVAALANAWDPHVGVVEEMFGLAYSQLCGTMQAHAEASVALGLQIGFATRNALAAFEMARAGLTAPRDIFEGPYGYFTLFEPGGDAGPLLDRLCKEWAIAETSYKPFPCGRVSHGAIDALMRLRARHGFSATDLQRVVLHLPPYAFRLGGRPLKADMNGPYARLCIRYLMACLLEQGEIGLGSYAKEALQSPAIHALAARVELVVDEKADINALSPQHLALRLRDGTAIEEPIPVLLGHPNNPMSRAQHAAKLALACENAAVPFSDAQRERISNLCENLENLDDVRALSAAAAGF
jgi:2-methylcitrate dehydratase PrpD